MAPSSSKKLTERVSNFYMQNIRCSCYESRYLLIIYNLSSITICELSVLVEKVFKEALILFSITVEENAAYGYFIFSNKRDTIDLTITKFGKIISGDIF